MMLAVTFGEVASGTVALIAAIGALYSIIVQRRGQVEVAATERTQVELEVDKFTQQNLVDDYKRVTAELKEVREEFRIAVELLNAKIDVLVAENHQLRLVALRIRDIPGGLPMGEFADNWLALINVEIAHPLGVHLWVYTDDVDQELALGHGVEAIEDVPHDHMIVATEIVADRRERLAALAEKIRAEAGYPPYVVPPVTDVTDEPLDAEAADE